MKSLLLVIPVIALLSAEAQAQLDTQRTMRNPSLAPRASVSGMSRATTTPQYTPTDLQPGRIERRQRQNMIESRRLEYGTLLPEYSRERQQVRDRAYKDFRDVEFIGATLKRNEAAKPSPDER